MKKILGVLGLVALVAGLMLFNAGQAGSSQYAGTNGKILYQRMSFVQGVSQSVSAVNADGTGDAVVVAAGGNGSSNAASTKLAYVERVNPNPSVLRIANMDGSSSQAVATAASGHSFPWANLSADGTKIVYADRDNGANTTSLIVINADGTGGVTIASGSGFLDWPQFSADGTQILYSVLGTGVFVVPSSGGAATQIAQSGINWASWTPDGKILAVDETADAIFRMNLDGTGVVVLLTAASINKTSLYWPMTSPDGTKMSFAANSQSPMTLYVANADGTSPNAILIPGQNEDFLFPV